MNPMQPFQTAASQLHKFNTSINIESLSPKQLLGECVDLSTQMFKELVYHYLEVNQIQNPFAQVLFTNQESRFRCFGQLHAIRRAFVEVPGPYEFPHFRVCQARRNIDKSLGQVMDLLA